MLIYSKTKIKIAFKKYISPSISVIFQHFLIKDS